MLLGPTDRSPVNGRSSESTRKRIRPTIAASAATMRAWARTLGTPKKNVNPMVTTAPATSTSHNGPGSDLEMVAWAYATPTGWRWAPTRPLRHRPRVRRPRHPARRECPRLLPPDPSTRPDSETSGLDLVREGAAVHIANDGVERLIPHVHVPRARDAGVSSSARGSPSRAGFGARPLSRLRRRRRVRRRRRRLSAARRRPTITEGR